MATWWDIQLDPQQHGARRPLLARGERRGRRGGALDRGASPSAPRPGSTWAWRSARAASGRCCATSACRPRATASASRRCSSARSTLDPAMHDAAFGIGVYRYYAGDRAGVSALAALAAAAARRRSGGGPGADGARPAARDSWCGARPTISCTSSTSGTSSASARRWRSCCDLQRALSAQSAVPASRGRRSLDVYFHDHARSLAASEALRRRGRARRGQPAGASPTCARASTSRCSWIISDSAIARASRSTRCSPARPPRPPMRSRAPASCKRAWSAR